VDAGTYRLVLMNAVVGRDHWLHAGPSIATPVTPLPVDVLRTERTTRPSRDPLAELLRPL